jgi:hypothetical protein
VFVSRASNSETVAISCRVEMLEKHTGEGKKDCLTDLRGQLVAQKHVARDHSIFKGCTPVTLEGFGEALHLFFSI